MTHEPPFDQFCIEQYKCLAAIAAEYEFRLRLFANKIQKLKKYTYHKLKNLEEKIFEAFRNEIGTDIEFLEKTRELRNKIIHADFKKLVEITEENSITPFKFLEQRESTEEEKRSDLFFIFLTFFQSPKMEQITHDLKKAINIIVHLNQRY